MELNTIKDAFERVTKKQKLSFSKTQEVLDQIGREIDQALTKIQSPESLASEFNSKSVLSDLNTKLKEIAPHSQLEGTQKELSVALSKYPRLLEKFFNPDISKAYRNVDFDTHTVNQIIAGHFYREGLFDIGDWFINEANEPDASATKSQFVEMYQMVSALRSRNLELALNWAGANHHKLEENGSDLLLKLRRLQFVGLLQSGTREDALKYARTFLAPFAPNHLAEVQKLMACLLWAGKLDCSPYSSLLSPTHWERLAEELTQQFCRLSGQPCESPLGLTLAAGVQALPPLLKLMNVMAGKKQEWQNMKQLPVPLDLGREFQFHSIFVCPVSRDQATDENPPMLMPCGHVLCKQPIAKMSKNNTKIFKCPYCPSDIDAAQCRQLHF